VQLRLLIEGKAAAVIAAGMRLQIAQPVDAKPAAET